MSRRATADDVHRLVFSSGADVLSGGLLSPSTDRRRHKSEIHQRSAYIKC